MKNLIIIGARGFGREIYFAALESIGYKTDYEVKGFLDDKADAFIGYEGYPPIIDSVENYIPQTDDVFVCALGDVKYKKKYVDIILSKGGKFINLIHKNAYVSSNVRMGIGCIVLAYARISCDVTVGDFVSFQPFTVVGHDVRIGSFCHLNTYSFLGGFVEVQDMVTINTGAIIHPKKKVMQGSTIGAGAFVIKNVKAGQTVYGNPAIVL